MPFYFLTPPGQPPLALKSERVDPVINGIPLSRYPRIWVYHMNMVQKCYQNFIMIATSFYQTNLEPPDKVNDPIHDPNVQLLEIPRVMNECYTRYTQSSPRKSPHLV